MDIDEIIQEINKNFNLNKYTIEDLHTLHESLNDIKLDGKEVNIHMLAIIDQLAWALDKNNSYLRTKNEKKKRVMELMSRNKLYDTSYLSEINNLAEQMNLVVGAKYNNLPLLVNNITHPLSKAFYFWRLKINK